MKIVLSLAVFAGILSAQAIPPTYIGKTKFNTGQDVVPSCDGWLRNADGTFTMVFGYLNRNWKEEPAIPAGDDNKLEPGPADVGQPTYFLPGARPSSSAWCSPKTGTRSRNWCGHSASTTARKRLAERSQRMRKSPSA